MRVVGKFFLFGIKFFVNVVDFFIKSFFNRFLVLNVV